MTKKCLFYIVCHGSYAYAFSPLIGHGGFGHVVLCKNKLDGRQYAVKKIRLKDKNPPLNDHILRFVSNCIMFSVTPKEHAMLFFKLYCVIVQYAYNECYCFVFFRKCSLNIPRNWLWIFMYKCTYLKLNGSGNKQCLLTDSFPLAHKLQPC